MTKKVHDNTSRSNASWSPRVWPTQAKAIAAIQDYLTDQQAGFYGIDCDFSNADLTHFSPQECWITYANFTQCVLDNVSFSGAQMTDAQFKSCSLKNAELSKAALARSIFDGANLASANMTRADADDASFVKANLSHVNLAGANVSRANFSFANLTNSNLDWAVLNNTTLSGTVVTDATGTVRGTALVGDASHPQLLGGPELEQWFSDQGALIKVAT